MAENVGFEPTDPCESPAFEAGALNQSQPTLRCDVTKWGTRGNSNPHQKLRRLLLYPLSYGHIWGLPDTTGS